MVVWQGITEGGTAVPVQVTEAGKVVAEGQQGPPGPDGPPGPPGPQGEYGPGDDVELGIITAEGSVRAGGSTAETAPTTFGVYAFSNNNAGNIGALNAKNFGTGPLITGYTPAGYDRFRVENNGQVYGWEGAQFWNSIFIGDRNDPSLNSVEILGNGSITAAGNKAGFTAGGELYFTSRGTRYKLEVAGGLCNAIPFTREMELRERAEALKEDIEDKRKPRPTDSVPED